MNDDMAVPVHAQFAPGDFVQERDSPIRGYVNAPGPYPGEWRITCADGSETTCLAENLILCDERQAAGGATRRAVHVPSSQAGGRGGRNA